jgi:hypothetical protein
MRDLVDAPYEQPQNAHGMRAFISDEIDKWAPIVKISGATAD